MVPIFPESELPFALVTYAKQRAVPLPEKALTEGRSTGEAGENLATSVPSPQEVDFPTHLCHEQSWLYRELPESGFPVDPGPGGASWARRRVRVRGGRH